MASILSIIFADNYLKAIRANITFASGLLITVCIVNICSNEVVYKNLIKCMLNTSLFVSIVAIAQYLYWKVTGVAFLNTITTNYFMGYSMAKTTSLYPSNGIFGYHLIFPVVVGLYLWSFLSENNNKILKVITLISITALIMTFSRGAWVAMICFILLYLYHRSGSYTRQSKTVIRGIITILSVILIFPVTKFMVELAPMSTFNRLGIVNSSLQSVYKNPFFGRGLAAGVGQHFSDKQYFQITETLSEMEMYGPRRLDIDFKGEGQRESHNTFLQVAVSLGIPACILYLYLIYTILINGRIHTGYKKQNLMEACMSACYLGFIVTVICSTFNNLFLVKQTWVVMGIVIAGIGVNKYQPTAENLGYASRIQSRNKLPINSN